LILFGIGGLRYSYIAPEINAALFESTGADFEIPNLNYGFQIDGFDLMDQLRYIHC
jgi:hypothetical protein